MSRPDDIVEIVYGDPDGRHITVIKTKGQLEQETRPLPSDELKLFGAIVEALGNGSKEIRLGLSNQN